MNDRLQLWITADIDMHSSIREMNKSLKALSQHSALRELQIDITINQQFIQRIGDYSRMLQDLFMKQKDWIESNFETERSHNETLLSQKEHILALEREILDVKNQGSAQNSVKPTNSSSASPSNPIIQLNKTVSDNLGILKNIDELAKLGTKIEGTNSLISDSVVKTKIWGTGLTGLSKTINYVAISLRTVKTALRGLLLSSVVGAGVAALGFVIEKIITHFTEASAKAKELKESIETSTNSWINHRAQVDELLKTYKELDGVKNKTNDQENEYLAVQQEIAQLMPQLVAFTTSNGDKHLYVGDQLERQLKLMEDIADIERRRRISNAKDDVDKELEKIEELKKDRAKIITKMSVGGRSVGYGWKDYTSDELYDFEIQLRKIDAEIDIRLRDIPKRIAQSVKDITEASGIKIEDNGISKLIEDIVKSTGDMENIDTDLISKEFFRLIEIADTLKDTYNDDSGFRSYDKAAFIFKTFIGAVDDLKLKFPGATKEIDQMKESLYEWAKAADTTVDSVEQTFKLYDEQGIFISEFIGTLEDLKEKYGELKPKLGENDAFEGYIVKQTKSISELSDQYKNATNELKELNQLQRDLNEGTKLSSDTIIDLILKYPELTKHVNSTIDGFNGEKEAINLLREARINEAIKAIEAQSNITEEQRKSLDKRLKAHQTEIDSIGTLSDAYNILSKIDKPLLSHPSFTLGGKSQEEYLREEFNKKQQHVFNNPLLGTYLPFDSEAREKEFEKFKQEEIAKNKEYQALVRDTISYANEFEALNNRIEVLRKGLSSPDFGKSPSSSKASSALAKEFQRFPYYKQQVDDLSSELLLLNKSIERSAREIEQADKMEDLSRKMQLEKEYARLLDQRKKKYHAIANTIRDLKDNEILPQFDKAFADFRKGRDFEDITQIEIQQYLDGLNEQISKTTSDKVKHDLENRRDLFSYFVGIFSDIDGAIKQQGNGWWQDALGMLDTLAKVTSETVSNLFKDFEKVSAPYDREIKSLQRQIELLDGTDEGYFTNKLHYSAGIVEQYHTQASAIEVIIQRLQDAKTEYKDIPSQVERIQQEIDKWQGKLDEIPLQIKRINEDHRRQKEDISKQIVDVYKKAYEAQRDAEIKATEASMKAEDERHKNRVKNLDNELKKFEDNVNAMIKSIDRQTSEEDYQGDLEKLYFERDEIKERLTKLSLSSDMADKAKAFDLEKDLAKKENEISKLKRNRENELRKQNLQDLLESKRKEIDGAKKAEDEKHEYEKKVLDALKEAREEHWKTIIENEEKYLQIQNDILSGKLDEIESELTGFKSSVSTIMGTIGEGIANNLTNILDQALKLLYQVNNQSSDLSHVGDTTPPSSAKSALGGFYVPTNPQEKGIIDLMKENSMLWNETSDQRSREEYHESNKVLGRSIGATYDSKGHWYKNGLRVYHDGGIVGGKGTPLLEQLHRMLNLKSNERLSVVELGELIIKKNPLANIAQNFKMPNLSFQSPAVSSSVTNEFYLNIDKVYGGKQSGLDFAGDVVKGMVSRGVKFK